MSDAPGTRASLLARIRDARDDQAWGEFVDLYAPVVYAFARRSGLQDADAADLTQEVLRAVTRGAGRLDYDPARGSFRGWLFTLARNKLRNFLTRRRQHDRGAGGTDAHRLLEAQPDPHDLEAELWDGEYRRRLFAWAAERVRAECHETTWLAFWRTAVEGRPAEEVSGELGMTVAAVYVAKSRVMARLREQVRLAEEE
jgi:RNA polymerase sigma-70 factor (ECF subfamily)